tara:strand:- start:13050 stop:13286 length:237 start_codon:yes stop_codon:yes gene_type:complete
MTVEIYYHDMEVDIAQMFTSNEFISISIDYMYNAVMGWKDGKELVIYDFGPICRLDNRRHTYELEWDSDKIVIDFEKT